MPFRSLMNGSERIPMSEAYGKSSRSLVSLPLSRQGSALNSRRSWHPLPTCALKPNSKSAGKGRTAVRSEAHEDLDSDFEELSIAPGDGLGADRFNFEVRVKILV